jgi:heme oxygenase
MQSGRPDLGEALRTHTRDLHTAVERSGVMRELLRGRVERSTYCLLLRNFHALYAALEDGLAAHATDARLLPAQAPQLARSAALAADLELLHGARWADALPLLPATRNYVERLRALAHDSPALLLAHAYVRYLGDLSGGQILRRIVAQGLGLVGGQGVRFYTFGDPDAAADLALDFRRGLDALDIDAAAAAALVEEARWGFARHAELFVQVLEGS